MTFTFSVMIERDVIRLHLWQQIEELLYAALARGERTLKIEISVNQWIIVRDGNLCAGWLACHGPDNLAALRMTRLPIDPAVFDYQTHVPVFPSGAAARRHGLARITRPGKRAIAMVAGLVKKLGDRLDHR